MGPNLILIGPPGAGKSSIGRQLSKALDVPFKDTDLSIEEKTGKKISEIFLCPNELRWPSKIKKSLSTFLNFLFLELYYL